MRALYPGSFDPLTLGHLDLVERGARLFDGVTVAVLQNPGKQPCFPLEQRLAQIREATSPLERVDVASFDGLTVTFAQRCGEAAGTKSMERQLVIIRPRSQNDFGMPSTCVATWLRIRLVEIGAT